MKYLIPFVYGFSTRAKTIFYKLSFFIVVLIPIFIVIIFNQRNIKYIIPRFILAFVALYCVYEVGYIFNDTYTVRFEENPTYRLNSIERQNVDKMANLLISVRVFVVIICLILLRYSGVINFEAFVIMLGLLDISYAFHNYFRSRSNIITIFFLLMFKYITIPVLFIPLQDYFYYAGVIMLMVPVIRTIEFGGKKEYGIKLFENFDHDTFRIFYYFVLILIFGLLTFISKKHMCGLVVSIYFFVFRVISFKVLKSKKVGAKIKEVRGSNSKEIVNE